MIKLLLVLQFIVGIVRDRTFPDDVLKGYPVLHRIPAELSPPGRANAIVRVSLRRTPTCCGITITQMHFRLSMSRIIGIGRMWSEHQ